MKIKILAIGKTDDSRLKDLISVYQKRLSHYINFEFDIIPDLKKLKNKSQNEQKSLEGQALLKNISSSDLVVLLDEKGKQYSSVELSEFLQKKMNSGTKTLCLIIGGPYGFSPEMYTRAQGKVSLSKMTFSHQMVRLFLVEQIYRAFTILKNEPYHHQ